MRAVAQEKPEFAGSVVNDSVQVYIETESLGSWYVLVLLSIELGAFERLNPSNDEFLRYNSLLDVGASLGQISRKFKVFLNIIGLVLQPSS